MDIPPLLTPEQNLVKMTGSKIIIEARKNIYGMTFEKVDELANRLKKIYSPTKTVHQLQGELGSKYMWERKVLYHTLHESKKSRIKFMMHT